ncbi:phospholipid-transporting ATPase 1 isoform X2 [Selaginella moellendorffii]|uniref:phospholipid-transporting ATPase 1 isoform X2 n=1 Tax=Selaginella moellendorffii TaxID=88036 RepID=UPI000D1CB1A4|nr:phospholipid-transporting ATPase 1 isoform X2 [Selaginella moellendorffii]|eukprot:XP_024543304.1 phospholipid-transporting ATPase 1 isoform X2 [Selaginella moellendorffii]
MFFGRNSFLSSQEEQPRTENGERIGHGPSRSSTGSRSDGSAHLDVSDPSFESFRELVSGSDLQSEVFGAPGSMQSENAPATARSRLFSVISSKGPQAHDRHPSSSSGAGGPALPAARTDARKERVVYVDNPGRTNENFEFSGNKVRTSKYTLISFLPRNLFEQFHRVAYIYFLLIVILNQIPQLAVFGRLASLFPLLFVLVVTAIKDGYEDWGRHRSDREENNRLSWVFQNGRFEPKRWKKIEAGEVVKIFQDESIPCDIVLLGTSDANGVAYVQTINLDGETNLKTRYARQESASKHPGLAPITGKVVCEPPNRNIYDFVAYLEIDDTQAPLGPNNIILRGCVLKNTAWIVGVVVYAGKETKAMLNSSGAQSKRSRLEQHMNKETLWLSFFLLIICIAGGVGMGKWVHDHDSDLNNFPYYKKRDTADKKFMYYGPFGEGVFAFLSFIIMFQIMIPISLYISMELVRLGQSYFMVRDVEMFHAPSNSRLQCRALNINEDLGQVKYIFSDKTGTLTENKMEFHSASIGGVDYSNVLAAKISGTSDSSDGMQVEGSHLKSGVRLDPNLLELLQTEVTSSEATFVHRYMLVLAACNTVVPTRHSGSLQYQAESPDEQALVFAASAYGYTLLDRTTSTIVLDVLGEQKSYKIVGIHEFDSVRKRMSIVVECPDNTYKLLVKGADTAVMDIIARPSEQVESGSGSLADGHLQAGVLFATQRHLDFYSTQGLRTLVVAFKDLGQPEFEEWHEKYKRASTALVDRVKLLREAASLIERNLALLGATAIEDRLQDGVPETISSLRNSGIKVWVLTGDKQETAISIGFSCALLTPDMEKVIVNANTKELCVEKLKSAIREHGITETKDVHVVEKNLNAVKGDSTRKKQLALIIDGNSLVHALSPDVEELLFDLAVACRIVICCRVAPLQKAGIVSLMKRRTKDMTLAIGDGANDVSMIQTADVGIGLSGQEGRQAVMASDFALGQFRFLKRLLLVHGHWNYQRLAYMVLYNFYRNAVFVMMLFWYILHTAFSAQTALFDWNLMFYSLIYTSVPTIVVGILDKDLSHKTLLGLPPLYGVGQRNESYNSVLFWATMLDTLWQSLVLFYVPFFTFQGTTIDIWGMGCLWAAAVVVLVNLHLAMDVLHWTWITHAAIWGSIVVSFACFFVLDALTDKGFIAHYRVMFHMASTAVFWLNILLVIVVALLPRFCAKVLMQKFWPSDLHIARELELKNRAAISEFVKSSAPSPRMVELDDVPYSDKESKEDE